MNTLPEKIQGHLLQAIQTQLDIAKEKGCAVEATINGIEYDLPPVEVNGELFANGDITDDCDITIRIREKNSGYPIDRPLPILDRPLPNRPLPIK